MKTQKSKQILFITDNFPPETNAPASRTFDHCKIWNKDPEVEITIITCFPNFPQGKVFGGYTNKLYQVEKFQGLKVIRVWSFISQNKGFALRVLDYVSFAFSAFIAGLFIKTDLIIATSPQFFTTWAGCALSFLKRVPWYFELRDIWPESIQAVGAMKSNFIFSLLEKIELFLYKNSRKVIAVTDSFKENLVSRGIDRNKIEIIKNGSNLDLYKKRIKDSELLTANGLNDKLIFGYLGTHGMAHGLDFILNSISKINLDKNLHFLFIGDGAEKENLVQLANKLELKNVTFLPAVSKEDVPRYLSLMDFSLVPLRKSDTFKSVIPSKIFESAAMNIPILLGVEGEAQKIVQDYNAGLCFEPENISSFEKNLKLIIEQNKSMTFEKGLNQLAQDFDREKLAARFLSFIKTDLKFGIS